MGTKGLIVAVSGGAHRVAQFCGWDAMPDRLGLSVLRFARWVPRDAMVPALQSCVWLTAEQVEAVRERRGYEGMYPLLSAAYGAMTLFHIAAQGHGELEDSIAFAGRSLFCEWCYVLDYDANRLEVHCGYNTKPTGLDTRFPSATFRPAGEKEYHPVRLVWWCPLDAVVSDDEYLAALEPEEALPTLATPAKKPRHRVRRLG